MSILNGIDPKKSINLNPEMTLTIPVLHCQCAKQITFLKSKFISQSLFRLNKCLVHANKFREESGNKFNKINGRNRKKIQKHQLKRLLQLGKNSSSAHKLKNAYPHKTCHGFEKPLPLIAINALSLSAFI